MYVLALTTGMRQGELLGLQWADVDLERAEFRVNRALQRYGGQLQLIEPKTAKSRRTGSLTASAVGVLQAHRARQIAAGLAPLPTAFVFTSSAGTALEPRNVTRSFKRLLRRVGLPDIRFHDLRHSFATLLLVQGVSPRVVMEMLGHSQITLTMNTYSHVIPALKEDAAARLDAILGGRK
jgi:integrase